LTRCFRAIRTAILGDRLMIATARSLGVPIVTRDSHILDYARGGHVQAIAG
jgi:predicted nucleic acid-binding protein